MIASSPSLVIFDCDGVLVDTEAVANRLLARLLEDAGYAVTYEDCRRLFVGRTIEAVQAHVEQATGRTLGADWPDFVRNETVKAFEAGVDAIPDVRSVIGMLVEHNVAFCVASSGRLEKMRTSLGKAGLLPLVEHALFSATMVDHGKPAPDLFLHAAKEMGCGPDTCIVIEDSIPGVQAGIAAGMRVFGYAGDPHTDADALRYEGAYVFHNMKALPDLLGIAQAPASNLGSVST